MNKENLFKQLEMLQDEKDIDKIADLFLVIISMYGLKVDEVSALNFYVMQKTLESKQNSDFMKERLNLDVKELGIEGVLDVQRALVHTYLENVKE